MKQTTTIFQFIFFQFNFVGVLCCVGFYLLLNRSEIFRIANESTIIFDSYVGSVTFIAIGKNEAKNMT